ncbi:MAG: hypothetical protein K2I68_00885, partial [Bacteroidales bacterium]|nr:hypothetical protein [Bacteroidales bacterium]
MKTNTIFRLFSGIALLLGFMAQGAYAYSGKDSRNGADLPAQGTLRVLVVFAEVTGDPNYDNNTWSWEAGKMPPNVDQMFDVDWLAISGGTVGGGMGPLGKPVTPVGPPPSPSKLFSCFFYDASFGKLRVKGDYYPELIKIPYNQIVCDANANYNYNQLVMDALALKKEPKSATGLKIPADFDAWTPTAAYLAKNNTPDGKIDNLIIIWRVNSRLATVNNSGRFGGGVSSTDGKMQSNNTQYMYSYDFFNFIVPHEFSHGLLGDNQYHNGG